MATITKGGTLPDTGVTKAEVYALVDSATITGIVNADVLLNDGMAQIGGFTDNFELDREAKFVYCRVRFELI